jgi:hypothetical protein
VKGEASETPYWIANFMAGIGMVACLMVFASSFPDGESQSPVDTVAADHPGVRSCVEQVQVLACATLEEIAVRSGQSGCASAILGQAQFLQQYVEESLKALPAPLRKAAQSQLRSKVMEARFGSVISTMATRIASSTEIERGPLEVALEVLRQVARRFESAAPTVAASDEGVPAFLAREGR